MTTCPRCAGQVYRDHDVHGLSLTCLQCGWVQPLGADGQPVTVLTIEEERRLLRLDRGPNTRRQESQPIRARKLEKIRAQLRLVE